MWVWLSAPFRQAFSLHAFTSIESDRLLLNKSCNYNLLEPLFGEQNLAFHVAIYRSFESTRNLKSGFDSERPSDLFDHNWRPNQFGACARRSCTCDFLEFVSIARRVLMSRASALWFDRTQGEKRTSTVQY